MLFSKKNFGQFFATRPSRRGASYSMPAHVQTLDSKVLLTATVVEPPIIDAPVESPIMDAPVESPIVDAPVESPITQPLNIDPPVCEATIGGVTFTDLYGGAIKMVSGYVVDYEGHVPGLKIHFGADLSGLQPVDVGSNGTFSTVFSGNITGFGQFILKDAAGNTVDTLTVPIP